MLVLGGAGAASAVEGPYPPPSDEGGSASPSRVGAGECTVFRGGGFRPGAQVAIADDGASRPAATAAPDGVFSATICFTTDAKRGRHDLTGTGAARQSGVREVSASVIVTGVAQSAGSDATTGGSELTGPAGSTGTPRRGTSPTGTTTTTAVPATVDEADAAEAADAGVLAATGSSVTSAAPLPRTGLETVGLVLAGTGLVTAGAVVLLLVERRARRHRRRPAVA